MNTFPHVVVTGGAGFIGSHLVERLLADGRRVSVIDDCSTGTWANLAPVRQNPALRCLETRVSDCQELADLMGGAEAVYHLAAVVGVDLVMSSKIRTIHDNLHETEVVVAAAARNRVPLVLASTSEVYGKSLKPLFNEDDDLLIGAPQLSRWSYACSKLMDEFLALAYHKEKNLPVVVVRLFNTVGPRQIGQYGMVLPRFIAAARDGRPLQVFGDGAQTRCFCYVGDTVEALVRLQRNETSFGQVFNVGNPEEVSIKELATRVIQHVNPSGRYELVNYSEAYPAGFEDMLRRKPSIEKLVNTTGFRPRTTLDEIIRLTAALH